MLSGRANHVISFRSSSVNSLLTACPVLRCVRMRPTFLMVPMNAASNLVLRKVRGAAGRDAHSASLGKGVLVGPEKREVPVVLRLLPLDHFLDAGLGELPAGVLLAIGHDHEDNQPRTVLLRASSLGGRPSR